MIFCLPSSEEIVGDKPLEAHKAVKALTKTIIRLQGLYSNTINKTCTHIKMVVNNLEALEDAFEKAKARKTISYEKQFSSIIESILQLTKKIVEITEESSKTYD